jgi:hypothetical protein
MGRSVAFLLLLAATARAEDYERAFAAYKADIQRPALIKRTKARVRLADTGDLRALDLLIAGYGKAEAPKDQVQYLIVSIVTDAFTEPEAVPALEAWRAREKRPEDAWLWFRTLTPHMEARGAADLEAIARGNGNVFLRAAAIETLRMKQHPGLLELIPELAAKLPPEPIPRAVLLESLAGCLRNFSDRKAKPEFRPAADAILDRMDEPATLDRTRIVLARAFSRTLGVRYHFRLAGKWRQELDFLQRGGKQASLEGYAAPPTFAGIEATGDRICYVIDFSDSMLEPLTPPEIEKLPKGPVSGTAEKKRKEKESANEAWKRAFEAVHWDRVKNRFDAAREMLKTSLLMLDEGKSFAVIAFGDAAALLKSTNGMVKATSGNVQKVFRELDSIRPGPKAQDRPHGTLRGNTNIHGGLHRAFKLSGNGLVGPGEYVNPATWLEGCDTVFLLSDGDPTWDDFVASDRKDPGDQAGDPETGARHTDTDTLTFCGPYSRTYWLLDDLERLNLFRKVEIHCVGMGEATRATLEGIAGRGGGQTLSLTDRK